MVLNNTSFHTLGSEGLAVAEWLASLATNKQAVTNVGSNPQMLGTCPDITLAVEKGVKHQVI